MSDDDSEDHAAYIRRFFPPDAPARPRADDRDRNRLTRAFVLGWLRQLPDHALWAWIDGVFLGGATEAQLDAWVRAVYESAAQSQARATRVGRPRSEQFIPGEHPLATRYEWHVLSEGFKDFSRDRQQHHARANRKRTREPVSLIHRERCLASPVGQRVDHAGLFAEFFDEQPGPIPTEMAARLLHHERLAQLAAFEDHARAQATQDPSAQSREVWSAQAATAAAFVKQFPTWETLYRKLRAKPDTKRTPSLRKTKRRR